MGMMKRIWMEAEERGNIKMRRWFNVALVIEVVACLAWNWFKLKGRGMI